MTRVLNSLHQVLKTKMFERQINEKSKGARNRKHEKQIISQIFAIIIMTSLKSMVILPYIGNRITL